MNQPNNPYPVHRKVSHGMIEAGICPTDQPYAIMLGALLGYEHGNAATQDLHKDLTVEQYGEVVLDIALSIHYFI